MAVCYVAAGINHFIHPEMYLKMMPAWLGWHKTLVAVSGAIEILFGLMLFSVYTRIFAAWGIIVLLIIIFPANIQMMLNYKNENNSLLWLTILRLPFQFLLIWWAYFFTKPGNFKP